ncbi:MULTISPECIES: ABC transporter permease subunit [Rhizobium]|uniref:Glycine betaine/proline transport system permease protein n=3 Tax=Rhizobium TaxID=379 RepID=A0AAE2MQ79_RHILE|nr:MULTISPECIES: ABC transporter permease subunit [Rhizobium]ARM90819.1 proline/glycine betaine ABC transporter permease protein [Rhizobium sp. CIAT894]MBB4293746.1 glycine betaine/proline transport system permease protein [Rhizobium leguminosarum]MBB4299346.1 glycine betaine/proline transport system permease protein [Rhizobium leguminosarum]MBB4310845.1 glycine betaine/proline transport system permease protein [Rhizobium leguminosarum]MBB4420043.1 glycine betaine/proline transport system perm
MDLDLVRFSPGAYLAPVIDWLNANFHPFFDMVTKVIEAVLGGLESSLLYLPFYAVILIAVVFAAVVVNVRVAVTSAIALTFCFLAGLWEASMQTLALVTVSVCISVLIAFPLGILASRYRKFEAAIRPVLDIMQTVPPWVYLIPAVMIFSLGRVPAIIATIVYGVPPMLRLTTLAFSQVPKDLLELGQATGASPRAILFKIEIPAATPTLLVGLNQCILLSLAIVVLAGLVGAGGLGAEVTRGLTRMEMGLGLRAGLAIVAVAIFLDRLSRGALQRKAPATAGN